MTTSDKLNLLLKTKKDIKAAIEELGQEVGDVPFGQYASKILELKLEGSTYPPASEAQSIVASASSQFGNDFAPRFALDGNMSTRWASANKSGNQYIQFDLGEVYSIKFIQYACGPGYIPEIFDLQTSNNGIDFTKVQSGLAITAPDALQQYKLRGINARFIRLNMVSTPNTNFYELKEFKVG